MSSINPDSFTQQLDLNLRDELKIEKESSDSSIGAYRVSGRYRGEKFTVIMSISDELYSSELAYAEFLSMVQADWPPHLKVIKNE